MSFDIAFISFNRDQDQLVPGLKSIIKNVPNYNEIIVVWDDFVRERPIDFDQVQEEIQHKIRVVKHTELYQWPESLGRWGWVRQQLAKLLCYTYSTSDYTWVCDGDVLVTGDPELFYQGKPVLRYDHNKPARIEPAYNQFTTNCFKIDPVYEYSFVGSSALMDNSICQEMDNFCQRNYGKSVVECVQELIEGEHDQLPCCVEFASYGNYCWHYHPDKFHLDHANWNYAPNMKLNLPLQIMWQLFNKDLDIAERIAYGH